MKLLRLNLLAFGHFTNTVLDFGSGDQGLHLVYGPNEAGKSSALRALRHSLYGIPERTADDFVHPREKLRIGVVLRSTDGGILEFIRRKGRLNTLRASDDAKIISESELTSFLSGVDESLFSTMFGIDHAALVEGGMAIVKGGGNIGQILFAAGSGISDFRKVQAALQSDADELFKSGGKNPVINKALSELRDTQKALRDTQLSAGEWARHDEALREALGRKELIERELAEKTRLRNRLERIRDALGSIGRRKELLSEFETYRDAVLLSEDFGERRREALTHLRVAENEASLAVKNLEEIRQSLNESHIPENLLENAELIEVFHKKLGEYLKDMLDRPRLEGFLSSAYSRAKGILSGIRDDLSIEQAPTLRLTNAEMLKIRELGALYEKLNTQRDSVTTELSRLSAKIGQSKARLSEIQAPPDTSVLRKMLDDMRKQGDIESQYQAQYLEIEKAESAAKIASDKLLLWKGDPESLEKLPVPLPETIDLYEDRLKKAEDFFAKSDSERVTIEQKLADIRTQIEQLRLEQEVPTESDLHEARQKRDSLWQKIRNSDFAKDKSDVFESGIRYADELADRLRREAGRVAQKASLLANRKELEESQTRLAERLEKGEAKFRKLTEEWTEQWKPAGITPNSPREMRSWLRNQSAIAAQSALIRDMKSKVETLKSRIDAYCSKFRSLLESLGYSGSENSLSLLLEAGYRLEKNAEKVRSRREQIFAESESRESESKDAEIRADKIGHDLSQWLTRWTAALLPLGLESDASPAQASGVLDDLKTLFFELKEADGFRKRIEGIDRDTREYSEKVGDFVKREVPELLRLPTEQIVTELNARLNRAREAKARQMSMEKQLRQEEKSLKDARHRIALIRAQMKSLCEEAGCQSPEALPEAETRSSRRREIENMLRQIEETLRKLSAGATLEAFVEDAANLDPDSIEPQISKLFEETEELGRQKSASDQIIGQERNELSKMDGSEKSALLAQDIQGLLAKIQDDAESYVRLRLASVVLVRAIEQYREKHQGPILKRSAELFSHITLSAFEGLRLEFDDKGDAVLVGVRSAGKEIVRTEQMSEGTGDQLYLAVRLASLEAFLEKHEPVPFVVDDILIKFDDERAIATLRILADMSRKTQVIFFTHHRHLVELAQKHLSEEVLFTHLIGMTSNTASFLSDSAILSPNM